MDRNINEEARMRKREMTVSSQDTLNAVFRRTETRGFGKGDETKTRNRRQDKNKENEELMDFDGCMGDMDSMKGTSGVTREMQGGTLTQ